MTKEDFFKEAWNDLTTSEQVAIFRTFAGENRYSEIIYDMWEFDDIMSGRTPTEIVDDVQGTSFNTSDDYFWYDDLGNLNSGDEYDVSTMAEDYLDQIYSCYISWKDYIDIDDWEWRDEVIEQLTNADNVDPIFEKEGAKDLLGDYLSDNFDASDYEDTEDIVDEFDIEDFIEYYNNQKEEVDEG